MNASYVSCVHSAIPRVHSAIPRVHPVVPRVHSAEEGSSPTLTGQRALYVHYLVYRIAALTWNLP